MDGQNKKLHVSRHIAAGFGVVPSCMYSINDIMHS